MQYAIDTFFIRHRDASLSKCADRLAGNHRASFTKSVNAGPPIFPLHGMQRCDGHAPECRAWTPDYSVRQIRKDIRRCPARYPVRWCFPTKSDNIVRPRRLMAHTTPRFSRGMYRITVHNTATAIQDHRTRRYTGPTWRLVVSFDVLSCRWYSLFVPYPALYFLLAPLRLHVPEKQAELGHF